MKKYSLTAKERKELKKERDTSKNSGNAPKDDIAHNEPLVSQSEESVLAQKTGVSKGVTRKRKTSTIIVSICMIVLFLTGVVVTTLILNILNSQDGDPIATIKLSNVQSLYLYIYEDSAPIAATNFMFLALSNFFDGTVFHDNQNDWLRFMGMEEDYSTYRGSDDEFCRDFKGFDIYDYDWGKAQSPEKSIFYYRLKKDTNTIDFANEKNTEGMLTFMYQYSSTMFQISCINRPSTLINGTKRESFTVFGAYYNEKTLTALRELNLGTDYRDYSTKNGAWYNPNEKIIIESVTIRNYDTKKWHGANGKAGIMDNFDTYMAELGGYNTHSTNYVTGIS